MNTLLLNNPFIYLRYSCLIFILLCAVPGYGQAPVITSVSPSIAATGSTITITGSNFDLLPANNIVYFGSTKATVTSVTATQLTVVVDTGAVFGPVSVLNTTNHLTGYQADKYLPTFNSSYFYQDTINFRNSTILQVGYNALGPFSDPAYSYITVLGDLDGDGKPDLVTTNRHDPPNFGNLVIYRNVSSPGWISSASFSAVGVVLPSGSLPAGNQPANVKLADIDGDGMLDLVLPQLGAGKVAVYRNTSTIGSITFAAIDEFQVTPTGVAPYVIGIADFDKDGKVDVAVTCRDSANVVLLQNTSTVGNISLNVIGAFKCGILPIGICTGDLDGDGLADIGVADDSSETVSVLKNTSVGGSISFAPRIILAAPGKLSDIQSVDLDGDGKLDIAVTSTSSNQIALYKNVGVSGIIDLTTFAPAVTYVTLTSPAGIATGDLNGDGRPDIVVADAAPSRISVFRNTSTTGSSFTSATFANRVDFLTGATPLGVNLGDLDGDGYPEIVATNNRQGTINIFRDYPLPIMDTISGPRNICASGPSITLTSGTVGGVWTLTNNTLASIDAATGMLTPHLPGKDTVILYKIAGGDTSSRRFIITFDSVIAVPAIAGPVSQCTGTPITLTNTMTGGTWATGDAFIATITPSGTSVTVNGLHQGIVNITYSLSNTCGLISATKVDTVKTTPSPGVITGTAAVCGAGQTTTLADTATGGVWSSNNTLIATVNGVGMVTSVAPVGSTTISYTLTNGCGSAAATVPFIVNVAPVTGTITGIANTVCEGSTITLTDTASGGVWSSSVPAVATVSGGIVGGASIGTTLISYTVTNSCGSLSDTQMVRVFPLPVVGLTTGPTSLCNGTVTGAPFTNTVPGTWSSSNTGVATINSGGTAGGASVGVTIISYSVTSPNGCGTATDTLLLTIDPTPNAGSIAGPTAVCAGTTITLTNAASGGTWISSNTARATVSGGVVTGVAAGNVIISYSVANSCGTATDTQMIVVNPQPNAGTIVGPGDVCVSTNMTLTNAATGGTWSSSAPAIASVVGGVVHGAVGGTAIISYSSSTVCGTQVDTQMVTVISATTPGTIGGPTAVCAGIQISLTTSVAGGTWSSSATGTATVANSGVVTGVAAGNVVISYSFTGACGVAVDTQNIVVLPQPNAGNITGLHRVCTGFDITLTNTAGGGTWTSSDASATVVGGVVHGAAIGTAIISFSITNSCGTAVDTQEVIVSLAPDAGLITGTTRAVCEGSIITLTNTASAGSWISANTARATVNGGVVYGVASGNVVISYTVVNSCGTATDTQRINVIGLPHAGTITGGNVICTGTDLTLSGVVIAGVWSSSNPAVASVVAGVVHGATVGTTIISYSFTNSCSTDVDTQMVQVNLSPDAGAITGTTRVVCEGSVITLNNTATTGSWISANNATATVSGGVVYGVAAGNVIISYSVVNSCGTAVDTQMVRVNPLPHAGIITGGHLVCTGVNLTLTNLTTGGTWSSSDPTVASVAAGVVHGAAVGTAIISYSITNSCGTDVDTQQVQVDLSPNAGVVFGPVSVCEGSLITLSSTVASGSWTSGNAAVATASGGVIGGVSAGSVVISYSVTNGCGTAADTQMVTVNPLPHAGTLTGATSVCTGAQTTLVPSATGGVWAATNGSATVVAGVVSGINPGVDTINYTITNGCGSDVVSNVMTVNLSPSVSVITGPGSVCAGQSITLMDSVSGGTWTASNGRATVIGGIVTGNSQGVDTITYTVSNVCGSVSATHVVVIDTLPPAGVINGLSSVCVGAVITLTNAIAGGVWSATNASATVSGGIVTGVANGADTILYTTTNICGSAVATKNIVVNNSPYVDTISGANTVCQGQVITLTNTVTGGVWTSDSVSIATVDTAGVVTGISGGVVTISYAATSVCGTATTSTTITVNPLPLAGTISGPTHLCLASTVSLTATASGGVWSASNGVATVSPTGIVTTISPGTDTISYTVTNACGSVAATHIVIVDALPDTGIITGPSAVCRGASIVLADTVNGGTWSSSNTAIASVTSGGVVTGISAGTVVIRYTVSLGCNVLSAHHIVTVNTAPVLTSTLTPPAICDSTVFTYLPSTVTLGASFIWSRDITTGIAGSAGGGVGIITEVLDNTTALPVIVTYTVALVANGCADTQHVVVRVNPTPTLTSSLTASLCGGTVFDYVPLSATPGAAYSWTRAAVTGITPPSSFGTGAIHDSAVNTTDSNVMVVYIFTITANGCTNTQQLNVILSPGAHMPHIDIKSPPVVCLNTLYQNFGTLDTVYNGEHYTWTASSPAAIWATGAGGRNSLVSFSTPGIGWIYLTATMLSSGCAQRDSFAVLVDGGISDLPSVIYFDHQFVCAPSDEDTYQWGYDDVITLDSTLLSGETNQNYYNPAPDLAGKYYWVITTRNGCWQKTYYNGAVAVSNVGTIHCNMSIVPNPNNGSFTLQLSSSETEPVHVVVTDLLGRVVKEWNTITNRKEQVQMNVAAGTYMISAITAGGKVTERVVVGE